MKEPDKPWEDLINETIQETTQDIFAEAQIVPTLLVFPKAVIEVLGAYERTHSIDRDHLLGEAIKAAVNREDELAETMERFMDDPDSFEWPLEDPFLCLLIGFLRKHASMWTENMNRKLNLAGDEDEPDEADRWKTIS